MKKLIAILVAVLALTLVLGIAMADDSDFDGQSYVFPTRIHGDATEYADEDKSTAPTCTTNGIAYYQCADDPTFFHEQVLYSLGHKWCKDSEVTIKEGDCKKGIETVWVYKCTREGCKATMEVKKGLPHVWSSDLDNEKDPRWGRILEAPTCTEKGTAIDYCINCGVTRANTREIDVVDHDAMWYVISAPQCTTTGGYTKGVVAWKCRSCGQPMAWDDEKGWIISDASQVDEWDYRPDDLWMWRNALEDWEWTPHDLDGQVVLVKPTCTSTGVAFQACKRCGEKTDSAVVAPLMHNFVEKNTLLDCYTARYEVVCSYCGKHPYELFDDDGWDVNHYYYAEWDYDFDFWYRDVWAQNREEFVVSHEFKQTKDYLVEEVKPTCTEEGYKLYKCIHFDEADCPHPENDESAYLKVPTTAALGHNWGEWVERIKPGQGDNELGYYVRSCKRCGETEELLTAYDPRNACAKETDHVWVKDEAASTAPTCLDAGKDVYQCSKCGAYKYEVVKAAGHDYEETVIKPATYGETGKSLKVCKVCGDAQYVDTPVLDGKGAAGFIARCYATILGRSASAEEVKGWEDAFAAGDKTAADLVAGFVNSEEYAKKVAAGEADVVVTLYEAMMDRDPDWVGYVDWATKKELGASNNALINGFAGSEEFVAICKEYDIPAGKVAEEARDQNKGVAAFVARCYRVGLDREGEPDGMTYWSNKLIDKSLSPKEVATGFVKSTEFAAEKKIADGKAKDVILSLYNLYLGRGASDEEVAYWASKVEAGMSLDELNNGFADSVEFAGIIDSFGLN